MIYLGNQQVGLNNSQNNEFVSYIENQELTTVQKERARDNIGAGSEEDVSELKSQTTTLTENALIELNTEKCGFHDVAPISVSFYPDEHLVGITAKYSNGKNFVVDLRAKGTQNGITRHLSGQVIEMTGTGTGQLFVYENTSVHDILNAIKGKTFNVYYYIKKSTPWNNASWLGIYDGKSYKSRKYFSAGGTELIGWTDVGNVTFAEDATTFFIKFGSLSGETFTDGDCIWIGMYESALVDTNELVLDTPYTIPITGLDCIDTATHESTVAYATKTKEYVDEHTPDIIGYWNEHVYALPEDFGAVGDGVADDSIAIADCITYAKTVGMAIRGYKTYKITNSVILDGRYLDVYLRELNYTGDGAAVEIQHSDIVFDFHRIQSNNIGLSFGRLPDDSRSAMRCQVKGNQIGSTGHCIEVKNRTYYNTCDIRYLSSTNGNCIHRNTEEVTLAAGEYVFRSSSCSCPNGWVSYDIGSSKFYDFTIEGNCKYGLRNPLACMCFGFRHREQIDRIRMRIVYGQDEYDNGPLIKFTKLSKSVGRFKYITDDAVFYCSIDTSEISGFDNVSTLDEWSELKSYEIDTGIVVNSMEGYNANIMGTKTYIIGGNLVVVPERRRSSVVDVATLDFRMLDSRVDEDIKVAYPLAKYLGTDYSLDVAHTDIYFNSYFGAIGYNDLTITQDNGNTTTIYDKLGNVIFDGTNEGSGKWRLQCIIDRSSYGRFTSSSIWWGYDGTNEFWEVTKIS